MHQKHNSFYFRQILTAPSSYMGRVRAPAPRREQLFVSYTTCLVGRMTISLTATVSGVPTAYSTWGALGCQALGT